MGRDGRPKPLATIVSLPHLHLPPDCGRDIRRVSSELRAPSPTIGSILSNSYHRLHYMPGAGDSVSEHPVPTAVCGEVLPHWTQVAPPLE